MSLADLKKLRSEKQEEINRRDTDGKTIQIIVGMGTCGIAAGAKDTLDALISELSKKDLADNANIKQTGCMGMCANEPTVEIIAPDMPAVIYGNVKADVVANLVQQHLVNKTLLENLILDKPSIDIVKN